MDVHTANIEFLNLMERAQPRVHVLSRERRDLEAIDDAIIASLLPRYSYAGAGGVGAVALMALASWHRWQSLRGGV